ncbi:L-asparagine transporter-like permease [Paenibacillus sp. DS2015]|uniref:amino acid permease n=1 Tax=Paenibacillus sp. DS2015 TaxID=3373917 RepID=UPI003D1C6E5C
MHKNNNLNKKILSNPNEDKLQWWQLSLLGVACTIGTGYFLGSALAITLGGPAVLISFIIAAIGTYLVFDVLAQMTAQHPIEGSFRSYAKQAYGRWAGFSSGWVYWSSELLIMGSQLTALSLFSRFWFPNIPMWILASIFAVLGLAIIFAGTKSFERMENLFAIIKVSALVMFIVLAILALCGILGQGKSTPSFPFNNFLEKGFIGLWSSLLFAFYAFGGIEIMGIMAIRLHNPKDAPKSGRVMLALIAIIYVVSLILAMSMISWKILNTKESPFLQALNQYNLPFVPHIFIGILIIAGFSTMVASLFAVTRMLVTLAEDHDAPSLFAKKRKDRPLFAIGMTTVGLILSIVCAMLLPGKVYIYITTAAGLMLLYNWFFILIMSGTVLKLTKWGQTKRILGMLILLTAISGSLFHHTSRTGFWVSLGFLFLIALVTLLVGKNGRTIGSK